MDPLVQKAMAFAAAKHQGQTRKDGVTPFFSHPARVAMRVAVDFGCDEANVVAAALLHDVIEDTDTDHDDLQSAFNERVAEMVAALSNDPRLPEPQLTEAFYATLEAADWQIRLVKLADTLDNYLDRLGTSHEGRSLEKLKKALIRLAISEEPAMLRAKSMIEETLEGTSAV